MFAASLLVILTWEELLTLSRTERPCREIETNKGITNCVKFNKSKCQFLYLGRCNPSYKDCMCIYGWRG